MRSSLTNLPIARPYEAIQTQLTTFLPTAQLYLALYLRLIPLPATIQDDIIPVVRLPFFLFSNPTTSPTYLPLWRDKSKNIQKCPQLAG